MGIPLRVLMVEDSEDDALLLVRELQRGGYEPAFERVASAAAMEAALERHSWDLVIGDHSMPHFSGMAALALVRARGLDVPFICVSGTISEEMAVSAMKAGANDWVTKGHLKRLLPAIERELREAKGRAALRASEAGYETLVEHAPIGIYRSTPQGRFVSANQALVRMLGYASVADVLRLDMARDVYADPAERQRLLDRDTYTDREYDEVEATWKRTDGRLLTVQLSVRAVRDGARQVEYYETFVRDVTDQRRLQQQLVQSQKMEAVGRLAGGIAHDFNNLLTVITSYSDLLLEDLGREDAKREDVEQIRKAAGGAAALTRQLLAFSRQQVLEPKVVSLSAVVSGVEKMLRRVLGEDVDLGTVLDPDLGSVKADVGQLEQVLMNLAVNARDAMPTGGKLTIGTPAVEPDPDYAPDPRARGRAAAPGPAAGPRGTETVLLVEDAAAVRAVTREVLERQGYVVLEAPNGEAALHLAQKHRGPIHLLLTDVVMPVMSGRQLADQLAPVRPDMKVLYASGYTDDSVVRHGVLEEGTAYLQKPFTPERLARKVRDVLDSSETRGP